MNKEEINASELKEILGTDLVDLIGKLTDKAQPQQIKDFHANSSGGILQVTNQIFLQKSWTERKFLKNKPPILQWFERVEKF